MVFENPDVRLRTDRFDHHALKFGAGDVPGVQNPALVVAALPAEVILVRILGITEVAAGRELRAEVDEFADRFGAGLDDGADRAGRRRARRRPQACPSHAPRTSRGCRPRRRRRPGQDGCCTRRFHVWSRPRRCGRIRPDAARSTIRPDRCRSQDGRIPEFHRFSFCAYSIAWLRHNRAKKRRAAPAPLFHRNSSKTVLNLSVKRCKLHRKQLSVNGIRSEMLNLRSFFSGKPVPAAEKEPNEAGLVSFRRRLAELALCFAGGGCFAAALPPLNFSVLALVALTPVIAVAARFALEIRGAGRLRVGRRLVALRLPFPARNRPGDPVPDAVGHFALAGLLGGVPAVPLAEHALSARGRTRRVRGAEAFSHRTGRIRAARPLRLRRGGALHTLRVDPVTPLPVERPVGHHVAEYSASSDRVGHRPLRNHVRPGLLRRCAGRSGADALPARRSQAAAARGGALRSAARGRTAALHAPCEDGGAELVPGPAAGRHLPATERDAGRGGRSARYLCRARPRSPAWGSPARYRDLAGVGGSGSVPRRPPDLGKIPPDRPVARALLPGSDAGRRDRFPRPASARRRHAAGHQQRAAFRPVGPAHPQIR